MPLDVRVWTLASLGAVIVAVPSFGCSQTREQPGDAAADQVVKLPDAAHPSDASSDLDVAPSDGGAISDWPGWRRLQEVDPNCFLDVPIDVKAQMPTLQWVPCATGQKGCQQIDTSSWNAPTSIFANGRISRDGQYLFFIREFDAQGADFAKYIYHLPDLQPLAAWRAKISSLDYCDARPTFTEDQTAVLYRFPVRSTKPAFHKVQLGQSAALVESPNPTLLLPSFPGTEMYESFEASDTAFAFSLTSYSVVRGTWGSSNYVRTSWPQRLASVIVAGNDVFAWNERGSGDGWHREARVDSDGSVSVFRGVASHHMLGFASDGVRWFWTEAYGGGGPTVPQPSVDIYSAPFTNDPSILDATKKKLLTFPPGSPFYYDTLAFNGLYIFQPNPSETDIVRASDGARKIVTQGGNHWCGTPLYATTSELWCIENVSPQGPDGVALTRLALDPW